MFLGGEGGVMARRPCRGVATLLALLVLAAELRGALGQCASASDCHNHGSCNTASGKCSCTGGYTGASCETSPCHGQTCSGHGACSPTSSSPYYSCSCSSGFKGTTCGECSSNVGCNNHGSCNTATGRCSCTGYTGTFCTVPVSCGNAPFPPHSSGCGGEKHYQDECTATCDNGWTGGTAAATFTCGANGHYSGSLTCERVSCPQKDAPANSDWDGGSCKKDFEGTCKATCKVGYTFGSTEATFTCGADGTYSGRLDCQAVPCDNVQTPAHASPSGKCTGMHFGDRCTMTCDKCHSGDGSTGAHSAEFTCIADKQKKGKISGSLECAVKQCPALPPAPPNSHGDGWVGTKTCDSPPFTQLCDSGWTGGTKQAEFSCGVDSWQDPAEYSGKLKCDRVACSAPTPSPPDTYSTTCTGEEKYEDSCTVTCDEGWTGGQVHHAPITTKLTCEADGRNIAGKFTGTHGTSLTCEKVSCHTLPRPAHSDQYPVTPSSASCTGEKHFNDKCTVECDRCWNAGLQAKGHKSKEFTCTSNSADAPDGKFDPPATALVCEQVVCGTIPQPKNSVSTNWDTLQKGNKVCRSPDDPNVKGPEHVFSTKCDLGWTGGTPAQVTVTCKADDDGNPYFEGVGSDHWSAGGALTCKQVPCSKPARNGADLDETLTPPIGDPGRGCPHDGCPSNFFVPDDCQTNHYQDHCTVYCADGFTDATRSTQSLTSQGEQEFQCVERDDKLGDAANKDGMWSTDLNEIAPHSRQPSLSMLRCDAVLCDAKDLPREEHTFDPLRDTVASLSANQVHELDQTASELNVSSQCHAHYMGFGDSPAGDTPAANGICARECWPSWYPADSFTSESDPFADRRLNITCQPTCYPNCDPKNPASDAGVKGKWVRDPSTRSGKPLQCSMGNLTVQNMQFDLKGNVSINPPQRTFPYLLRDPEHPYDGGDTCQGYAEAPASRGCFDGYTLAPRSGPTMNFHVIAKDEYDKPRNYRTLDSVGSLPRDMVLAIIKRVPLDRLDDENRRLQPKKSPEGGKPWDCCKDKGPFEEPDCWSPGTCPLREYELFAKTSQEPDYVNTPGGDAQGVHREFSPKNVSEGADGLWQIKHQFEEHGVFYISIYVCPYTSGNIGQNCQPKGCFNNPAQCTDALVRGTGLDTTDGLLPSSAFTVCPQNTEPGVADVPDMTENVPIIGQHLQHCKAKSGYYSPKGPGHIAEKCLEGFNCNLVGMRWPVALPDNWVDPETPSNMMKCERKGACPGSELFVDAQKACPSSLVKGDTAYDESKLDFEVENLQVPNAGCYMRSGKDSVAQSNPETFRPFLEKQCRDKTGSRCCPGATGPGCQECCKKDLGPPSNPSCNFNGWYTSTTGEGVHCEQCPDEEFNKWWLVIIAVGILVLAPILVKIGDVFKHAGAVTGPALSVINFIQSANLFIGLDLHWPPQFKAFCHNIAQFFSSLDVFHFVLDIFQLPKPECAFGLTYVQKWFLVITTPIIIVVLFYIATICYILLWKALGLGPLGESLWRRMSELVAQASCCRSACTCRKTPGDDTGDQILHVGVDTQDVDSPRVSLYSRWCGSFASTSAWQFREWDEDIREFFWKDFEIEDQEKLNAALQNRQRDIKLKRGAFTYAISLENLEQRNESTGRVRKIRPPNDGMLYRFRLTRVFLEHSWSSTTQGCVRFVLLYLLVGYTFLAGQALEPLACKTQLDLTNWIAAAPFIKCDVCGEELQTLWADYDPPMNATDDGSDSGDLVDEHDCSFPLCVKLNYRQMVSISASAFMLYGLGTPIIFGVILYTHRDDLQSNEFTKRYGFLVTKMKTEYFWWEIFIAFRKLLLVVTTKFSSEQRLPCSLINLFITIVAFGTQVYTLPFAHNDANVAESLTLLATILILVLGLAQDTQTAEQLVDSNTVSEAQKVKGFIDYLNYVIYTLMFLMVGFSCLIVLRRMNGAFFNYQYLNKLEHAQDDGRQVSNDVRRMLAKKWLIIASAWAAIDADEAREDEEDDIEPKDRVRLVDLYAAGEGELGYVKEVRTQDGEDRYLVELSKTTVTESSDTERFGKEEGVRTITRTVTKENRWVRRDELVKEGDIERMHRVFKTFKELQQQEVVQRWLTYFESWDDFFPEKDRRIMYLLSGVADDGDIDDLLYIMQEMKNMDAQQLSVLPRCCIRKDSGLINPDWLKSGRPGWKMSMFNLDSQLSDVEMEASAEVVEGGRRPSASTLASDLASSQLSSRQKAHSCFGCFATVREFIFGDRTRATLVGVLTLISAYVTFLCLARMMIAENLVPFGARGKCHHEEFPYFFRMLWVYWTSLILGAPLALLLWWKWCRPQWRQHGHRVTAAITSIRRMTDFTLNPGRASRPTEGGGGARARLDAPLFGDLASQDSASVVSRPASPTRMNRSAAARANGAKKTKRPSAGATGWRGEAIRADHISQPQPEPEPEPELQLRPQPEPEPEPERGTFWGRSRAASLDTPVDDDDDDDYSSGGEDDPNWRTRNRLRARRTGRD